MGPGAVVPGLAVNGVDNRAVSAVGTAAPAGSGLAVSGVSSVRTAGPGGIFTIPNRFGIACLMAHPSLVETRVMNINKAEQALLGAVKLEE